MQYLTAAAVETLENPGPPAVRSDFCRSGYDFLTSLAHESFSWIVRL